MTQEPSARDRVDAVITTTSEGRRTKQGAANFPTQRSCAKLGKSGRGIMAAKKTQAILVGQTEQQAAGYMAFSHAVESPYRAGWEHALTAKYGRRGKAWTSTKSAPQWTVHFRNGDAAAWFRNTWTA